MKEGAPTLGPNPSTHPADIAFLFSPTPTSDPRGLPAAGPSGVPTFVPPTVEGARTLGLGPAAGSRFWQGWCGPVAARGGEVADAWIFFFRTNGDEARRGSACVYRAMAS